jgi:Holliday junction DNA helicase RuvA
MYSYIHGNIIHIDGITISVLIEWTGLWMDIMASPIVLGWILWKAKIELWIHHHITEAGQVLFWFDSPGERSMFRQLLKVNGIGGKTALSLLWLGQDALLRAIQFEDDALLSSVPWIGKKTAQKIIVDLKWSIDFSKKDTWTERTHIHATDITVIASLVSMGYEKAHVEEIIRALDTQMSVEAKTIAAIKKLSQ